MKPCPQGFLSPENIDHDSEIFNYIAELHAYLWKFVDVASPGASGHLEDYVDVAVDRLEVIRQFSLSLSSHHQLRQTGE